MCIYSVSPMRKLGKPSKKLTFLADMSDKAFSPPPPRPYPGMYKNVLFVK